MSSHLFKVVWAHEMLVYSCKAGGSENLKNNMNRSPGKVGLICGNSLKRMLSSHDTARTAQCSWSTMGSE